MEKPVAVEFRLPFRTVATILVTLLFVASIKMLAPLLMSLFLASLLAVALHPILKWLESHHIKRGIALGTITLVATLAVVGLIMVLIPKIYDEGAKLAAGLPHLKEQILAHLSEQSPVRTFIENNLNGQSMMPKAENMSAIFSAGNMALGGVAEVILIFVFAIYLVADEGKVFQWIKAFFAPTTQHKIQKTADEVSTVVSSYIMGQFITSFLSFIYVTIALSILHVPNALLLGTLAGLLDVIPVLGFFLAVIPAVLFALPVSSGTAVLVVVLYLVYHGIENYLVVPAVYGNRLRVSSLVVLVTLVAAGTLAGIEGAIAVLPVVASYPIIERIWLRRYLGNETISEHAEIEA